MCDILEAVTKTMCEVISRIDLPLRPCSVMLGVQNSICWQIPHLRVSIFDVLLHSEESFFGLVFAISHSPKLLQILFDRLFSMFAAIARTSRYAVYLSSLGLQLLSYKVIRRLNSAGVQYLTATFADVCFPLFNELLRLLIQLVEIIAGICYGLWLEA